MPRGPLKAQPLGPLEAQVMRQVWRRDHATVREIATALGSDHAYTTVMTTLDRLHKKGLVRRTRAGNAFVYVAALSAAEFDQKLVEAAMGSILRRTGGPALSAFVDAAAEVDERLLVELEALVAARLKGKP